VADGISGALASDSLEQLTPHVARLGETVAALRKEIEGTSPWPALVQAIERHSGWPQVPDLAAARTAFLPFSTEVVALVQQLRAQGKDFRRLKVYHCPMAPKPGLWFQARGPLRNPFYGSKMLSCGEEVRAPSAGGSRPAVAPAAVEDSKGHAKAAATVEAHAMPRMGDPAPAPGSDPDEATAKPSAKPATSNLVVRPRRSRAESMYDYAATVEEMRAKRWAMIVAARTASGGGTNVAAGDDKTMTMAQFDALQWLPLAPNEAEAIRRFLAAADGWGRALAEDNLGDANRRLAQLPGLTTGLTLHFRVGHRWWPQMESLVVVSTQSQAKDLDESRAKFLRFSNVAVAWVRLLRQEETAFADLKIYRCPDAPAPGQWFQQRDPSRNPYLGATRAGLGEEVPSEPMKPRGGMASPTNAPPAKAQSPVTPPTR
jgi:hypothetical protein